jgi:glycosyltransferase 2 family protein
LSWSFALARNAGFWYPTRFSAEGRSVKNITKLLIMLAKITASVGILAGLFYLAVSTPDKQRDFMDMLAQKKSWGMLAAGYGLALAAIVITMLRWWYLVRALEIDFSMSAAVRIGFLGYLFNFAPMGIVTGDLLKAWILARERPGNRAKALASVIVDRIIGLYVLFLVAVFGIFSTGLWFLNDPNIHLACWIVLGITVGSTFAMALIVLPGLPGGSLFRAMAHIPKIGHAIDSLLTAIRIYRSQRGVLFLATLMTVPVHVLLATSLCCLAFGLGFDRVPWSDYLAINPIPGILTAIPLPAGPTEMGIVIFYKTMLLRMDPAITNDIARQQGTILALVYRLSAIMVVPIGAAYYFLGARSEVKDVMHDMEEGEGKDGDA